MRIGFSVHFKVMEIRNNKSNMADEIYYLQKELYETRELGVFEIFDCKIFNVQFK